MKKFYIFISKYFHAHSKIILISFPLVVILIWGGCYAYLSSRYVTTDNAYVKIYATDIASSVPGQIQEVKVKDNQHVEEGEILCSLDERPYRYAFEQAKATLGSAENQIEGLKTSYRSKAFQVKKALEDKEYRQRNLERENKLYKHGAITAAGLDNFQTQYSKAIKDFRTLSQDLDGILSRLDGNPDVPVQEHPSYLQAQAQYDKAKLDLSYCTIHAPRAGIVTKVELQVGEVIAAGTPLFSLVHKDPIWIDANFKETDLANVKPGQKAFVEIDMYPGVSWEGSVETISPSTGAVFSLLPPQNATGNWVKVVQRIPVRIAVISGEKKPILRAGMSAYIKIDTTSQPQNP